MASVLLIDLSGLYWPAYKATAGVDIGAATTGTIERVHRLAGQYAHVGVACDAGRSFRKEISPDYKSNREADTVAADQLRRIQDRLAADGFALLLVPGYEADDVLATAAKMLAKDHEVTIASSDKDLVACIDGTAVNVLNTTKGEIVGEREAFAKFGVRPNQMRDYLALIGDKSDNVPGVAGVGPTHAARLLEAFDNIDRLRECQDSITPPGIREKVKAAFASGALELSRKLITLIDVPGLDVAPVLLPRVAKPLSKPNQGDFDMPDTEGDIISAGPGGGPQSATPAPTTVAADSKDDDAGPRTEAGNGNPVAVPVPPPPAATSTALVPVVQAELIPPTDPRFAVALEPRTGDQAWKMAQRVFDSRLFLNMPNAETCWLVIMMARGLGVDSMTLFRNIHVVDTKLCLHAAMIVGLVLRSGKASYFKIVRTSAEEAVWKTHRKDDPDDAPTEFTWTIERAKRAIPHGFQPRPGKQPGPWMTQPEAMLRHRCATELARAVFPDVVTGLYDPSEIDNDRLVSDPTP